MLKRNVLVFGATSAVAQGVCRALLEQYDVSFYFVARNQQKLSDICDEFSSYLCGSYCLDLNMPSELDVALLLSSAHAALGSIDTVLFAQGDLFDQLETERSISKLLKSFQLNALSVLTLITQVVSFQHQTGVTHCKFLVITSVAGDRGRPRNFTYGAAKKSVSTYLQGLRSVYYRSGFEFYDIRLGPVDTPMTVAHEKNFSFSTVDKVSNKIVKLIQGKQYIAYVPGFWRWVMLVVKVMPEWLFQKLGFLSDR